MTPPPFPESARDVRRLRWMSQSEAQGLVVRREWRGQEIRKRLARFGPHPRSGVTAVALERLDGNSRGEPAGSVRWVAVVNLLDTLILGQYEIEERPS